jgi:hypothetical protein
MQKNENQKNQSAQQANSTADTKNEKVDSPKNDVAGNGNTAMSDQDGKNKVVFNRAENQAYLETRLKFQGFDTHLNKQLNDAMDQGKPKFTLDFTAEFKGFGNKLRVVDYEVNFKKDQFNDSTGQKREAYSIDTVQATLRNDLKPDESRSQTFYMNQSRGIPAKVGFNMLEGRSVMRNLGTQENERNTWLQLNFKKPVEGKKEFTMDTWSEKHGFDLEKAVLRSGVNIKNIDYPGVMDAITTSLKKGEVTPVWPKEGDSQKFLIADPRERTVRAYDSDMQRIGVGVKEYHGESKEQFQEKVQQAKAAKEESNVASPSDGKSVDSSKSTTESKGNEVSKDDNQKSRSADKKQSEAQMEIQGSRQRRSRGVGI